MLNVPNALTLARIILIVPFAALFYLEGAGMRWGALALFVIAAVTDWFDGYLARVLNQGTALGRMLDPIADKLLVVTALVLLVATGGIAGWSVAAVLAILLREMAVSGFREHLGPLGIVVPVTQLAKWKTTVQLIALILLIAPIEAARMPGLVLLWAAAALTVVTGYGYLRATIRALS
jgi:cardiolipin synthase